MNIDDPKLTAYALGELTGEERQAIEIALRDDPEARAFVEETAAFAQLLSKEFHAEMPPVELGPEQRSEVMEEARGGGKVVRFPLRRITWGMGIGALAAALAIAAVLPWGKVPVGEPRLAERGMVKKAATAPEAVSAVVAVQTPLAEPAKISEPTSQTLAVAKEMELKRAEPQIQGDFIGGNESRKIAARPLHEATPTTLALCPPPVALTITSGTGNATAVGATLASDSLQQSNTYTGTTTLNAGKLTLTGQATNTTGGALTVSSGTLTVTGGRGWSEPMELSRARVLIAMGALDADSFRADKSLRYNYASPNTESYTPLNENPFQEVAQSPLSTFSIDVDTASYSNVRRFLKSGQRPPPDAVRIEELINYFHYDYPQPKGDAPFSVNVETAQCPWEPEHRLVRIGLKGREIAEGERPASNLIFLMDVSGSMADENKLPLLKQAMRALVEKLTENDKVAIVVYAGSTGVALPPTRGDQKERIFQALDGLHAEGCTNGGDGIRLAYKTAAENLIPKGTNRVILATDGDFNVGTTSESELVKLIEEKRQSGVFLTVLGVGEGNLKDSMMKKLASHGNGNYAYIDSLREGRKVLVKQLGGTLVTIAKDVKIQVEFNPQKVAAYRLVGYESRMLAKEDFNNDQKDAGEIGAGHTVTALYEVVPAGMRAPGSVDALKYQPEKSPTPVPVVEGPASKEMLTIKLRYKKPTEETSLLIEQPVSDHDAAIQQSSPDFRFAAAVAEFGMLLRGSNLGGSANWDQVHGLAANAEGRDEGGYRGEFLELVEMAATNSRAESRR